MRLSTKEQPAVPRYSLMLFCLVCTVILLLVAWVGITRQPVGNPGFSTTGPRPLAFIEPGELVHEVARDIIHGPTGVSVHVTLRIELNHDRILAQSINDCLVDIENYGYSVQASLNSNDYTFIEDYASRRINAVNGRSATRSVNVTEVRNAVSTQNAVQ